MLKPVFPNCAKTFMQYLSQNPAANRAYQKIGCPRPIDVTLSFTDTTSFPLSVQTLSRQRFLNNIIKTYDPNSVIIDDIELLRVLKPFRLHDNCETQKENRDKLINRTNIVARIINDNPYSFYDVLNRTNVSSFSFSENEPLNGITTYIQAAEESLPSTVQTIVNVSYGCCQNGHCGTGCLEYCSCDNKPYQGEKVVERINDIFAKTNTDYICIVDPYSSLNYSELGSLLSDLKNERIDMRRLGFEFRIDWPNEEANKLATLVQMSLRYGVTRFNTNCLSSSTGIGGVPYPSYYGGLVRHLQTIE